VFQNHSDELVLLLISPVLHLDLFQFLNGLVEEGALVDDLLHTFEVGLELFNVLVPVVFSEFD